MSDYDIEKEVQKKQVIYEVCKIIHSVLVEEPAIIYQIHLQTYKIEIMEELVENVESLHVILNNFIIEQIQNDLMMFVEMKPKVRKAIEAKIVFHVKIFALLIQKYPLKKYCDDWSWLIFTWMKEILVQN